MESEHRDSPSVHDNRINFTIAVTVGNHLPASSKGDVGPVGSTHVLFQTFSISIFFPIPLKHPNLRHMVAASDFDMISAWEANLILLIPQPPRHKEMGAAIPIA